MEVNIMLRRQPTEIVLKLDEIDEMIMEMKKRVAVEGEEVEVLTQNAARTRIGAPSPRIRMTQASDTQHVNISSNATNIP
ncbi:unnamed protein product [Litomosoides sigmodontis]|uniref:Anaphase-promoting complex subunit CDC26 n=1 Tax=Litomosoides sigmodontis TaxID=42156 RepID=A0A3P6SMF8_LITSI|nr:unnamed protein product [Litomosoides sigmodontis]